MSRDKSVWFAEEILLDAKLINFQLETGEWDAVEEMLRAEAQLSRDADTGRLRPKKASEYTLRLIAEVLHIMRLDIEQASYNLSTLAVAEQCLRLIRSCAASGTKMQTYISKDLSILDSMVVISTEYQHPNGDFVTDDLLKKYESCMVVLIQTLGNLVVNNPFNQIIIWDKFDSIILNALVGQNEKIASGAAMIVYNILLGQPNVLPDDVALLNSLSYMYGNGNTEFPHLIIEYLIGVENTYIEKLYAKLEPDTRLLVLNLAYNILMSTETQDINVSVNFVRFMAHEFKNKSDLILKTVDKYVCGIEPSEVVFLIDILATASSMDTYMDCLQADVSLFINCAFLLRSIHSLGKHSDNFFSSINKLYNACGKRLEANKASQIDDVAQVDADRKKEACQETTSECTESESSEQYFECSEQLELKDGTSERDAALKQAGIEYENALAAQPIRKISLEHKIVIGDDSEPPLIMDPLSPMTPEIIESMIPETPIEARTDSNNLETEVVNKQSPSEISPPLLLEQDIEQNRNKNSLDPNKEVKRSQNLSTDFDLSEQLQKILGISGTVRSDSLEQKNSNTNKPTDSKTQVKMKVPSVKIDSPEGQKTRIGGFEEGGGPKKMNVSIESVEQHVAFGFKASLVRILGNLCWKNQINKRQIRDLEVIPVLLDCCNIDARNPLIMQWVIFAVRNLCENCPENQELIASLTLQGPVDTESLREMGLTLHADPKGNTIKVAPLIKN